MKENDLKDENKVKIEILKDYGSNVGRIVKIDLSSTGLLEILGGMYTNSKSVS